MDGSRATWPSRSIRRSTWRPRSLVNCEPVLLGQLFGWLDVRQRPRHAAGPALRRRRLRRPAAAEAPAGRGRCDTITNVRVTDRAIEETILLDFTIQNAGIRQLSFLLPGWMAGSRISVPMLRQKTVEPVSKEPGAPLRVKIELQDDVMGQLRVLVENDRLLTPGSHEAPIPVWIGRQSGPGRTAAT